MDHAFEHEGWHVSLLDAVRDLSAAQAAWSPASGRNSIWSIVDHVALWKEEEARRIRDEVARPAGWAKAHDWQDTGEATQASWQQALRRLGRATHTGRSARRWRRSLMFASMSQLPDPRRPLPRGPAG